MTQQRCLFRQLHALRHDRRGGPAMEFAVIAPILVVVMIFAFDLGNALQQRIRLAEAVRAGGLFALSYPTDTSNAVNTTAIRNAVTNAVSDWSDLSTPTVTMACYCWNRSANTFGSAIDCVAATSTTCASTAELQRFITISASRPFSPLLVSNLTSIAYSHVVRFQ